MFGLETLQLIWFILWGLLWGVYFVLDGFDLGMGTLLPFIAKNETEKRIIFNAAGPFWDGNEVWLITAGGVTFAAFPKVYAVMFSALYAPLLMLLFALIFRAVSFEFRNKGNTDQWRKYWDICQFLGSFLPALLLGVAFGNLFQGIPFDSNGVYHGNLLKLLNPYGLLAGVLFVLMFAHHGLLWLSIKSEGALHDRARAWSKTVWLYLTAAAVLFLVATYFFTNLYQNYFDHFALFVFPILAVALLFTSRMAGGTWASWFASAGFILCCTFFGVFGMFPGMLISNLDPAATLTCFNASSSELTLKIMLVVALICVPVVLLYQIWVYWLFSHKVTDAELQTDHAY